MPTRNLQYLLLGNKTCITTLQYFHVITKSKPFAKPTCGQLKSLILTIIFQLKSILLNPIYFESILFNLNIYKINL
jgi:hypothetical protein